MVLELPDEMTPAIRDALGLPNFRTGPIAHAFRAAGADIKTKCEDEQAFVLYWALKLAIQHGISWREIAGSELNALKEAHAKPIRALAKAALEMKPR